MGIEPTVTVDPALETAASALRADLAARGVPADDLPEEVVLALAAVVERIVRLETVAYPPVVVRPRDDPATWQPNPDGRYPLCIPRIDQADVCERCGGTIDPAIERPCPWVHPSGRWGPSVSSPLEELPPDYLRRHDAVLSWSAAAGVPGPIGLWQYIENQTPHPGSRIDGTVRVRGADGRWYTFPTFDDGTPGRAMPEPGQDPFTNASGNDFTLNHAAGGGALLRAVGMPAPGPETPRFRHNCPDCTFLGRSTDGTRDLYWCDDTRSPVSVYGDAPGQFDQRDRETGYPVEAHRRAVARGLVGGAGEGEGG